MKQRLVLLIFTLALLALPVVAQEGVTHTITYDALQFQLNTELATDVIITNYPGDEPTGEYGAAIPPHTQFLLHNRWITDSIYPNPMPESPFDAVGGIFVFKTADFGMYAEYTRRYETLLTMLSERPDLSTYETPGMELPYIPVYAAAQSVRTQAHYIDTANLQGIAYVTVYQQVAEPLLKDSLFYTVQAVSADGTYFVTLVIPLETVLLPETTDVNFDIAAFVETETEYLAQTMADLDAAAASDFSPSLTNLDTLVGTLRFDGITTP